MEVKYSCGTVKKYAHRVLTHNCPVCNSPHCLSVNIKQKNGVNSRWGNSPGKGGDIRSIFKSSLKKRRIRRGLKKGMRQEGKKECEV